MIYDSECIQKNNDLRNDLGRFDYFSYIVTNRYVSVQYKRLQKVQATVESIDQNMASIRRKEHRLYMSYPFRTR